MTSTVFALEVVPNAEHARNRLGDSFHAGKASRARHAAGKVAFIRRDNAHAASSQNINVLLGSGMLPHVHMHRGSDDHWRCCCEKHRRQEIVGDAARKFGQYVGRRRRDDQGVDALRHSDVFDGAVNVG